MARGPEVGRRWRSLPWRTTSVVLWTPVLLVAPVLDLGGGTARSVLGVALVVAVAAGALVAATVGGPPWRDRRAASALGLVVVAVLVASALRSSAWLPAWVLLANAVPTALHGRRLVAAVLATAGASGLAAWAVTPARTDRVLAEVLVVLLTGIAASALATLVDTVAELRRTQDRLARVAVAEERERFARDLHDLLGHTLSVMVVKAQAVRRLAPLDPATAAEHAADIEQIGRRALVEVRQAVDRMRAPELAEELAGARLALGASGVDLRIEGQVTGLPALADETLAWVVREGVTNVLRHSGARSCQVRLTERGGRVVLVLEDDGAGVPGDALPRSGGLVGLRERVRMAGGELDSGPGEPAGWRLVASVPAASGSTDASARVPAVTGP